MSWLRPGKAGGEGTGHRALLESQWMDHPNREYRGPVRLGWLAG